MSRILCCGLLVVVGIGLGQLGTTRGERDDLLEAAVSDPKLKFQARQHKDIDKLVREKLAAARARLSENWRLVQIGTWGKQGNLTPFISELFASLNSLLDAELELAATRDERIAALEKHWLLAKTAENILETSFKAGRINPSEVNIARYHRLDAEIRLARARQAK